jgi:ribose-phosphate pyrophosphokinase
MSRPLLIALPGNAQMADKLATLMGGETGIVEMRVFPDGESYLRFAGDVKDRSIAIVCTLARPNEKILPLLFAAAAARELGAAKVGLVAPYLCYMRQDRRFQPGEAVTSRYFAALISRACDWLVTVDPHLHRYKSLEEIYAIPTRALHAGELFARWICANVQDPFLIGPDEESRQWVSEVAQDCGADFMVLRKERLGDRDVRITADHLDRLGDRTPVLLDDIVSSGKTMLQALQLVRPLSHRAPVVIALHGLFADGADQAILQTGARLVTTNSVPQAAGLIDLAELMAPAILDLVG